MIYSYFCYFSLGDYGITINKSNFLVCEQGVFFCFRTMSKAKRDQIGDVLPVSIAFMSHKRGARYKFVSSFTTIYNLCDTPMKRINYKATRRP